MNGKGAKEALILPPFPAKLKPNQKDEYVRLER